MLPTTTLKLSNDGETLIDAEDASRVSSWGVWSTKRRAGRVVGVVLQKGRKRHWLHHVVLNIETGIVRHINGNKLENRKENLYLCGSRLNCDCGNKIDHQKHSKMCENCYKKKLRRLKDPLVGTRPHGNGSNLQKGGSLRFDLSGQRFYRWKVLEYIGGSRLKESKWKCQCDCGEIGLVTSGALRYGESKSCGCYAVETRKLRPYEAFYNKTKYRISIQTKWTLDMTFEEFLTFVSIKDCHYCGAAVVWQEYAPAGKSQLGYNLDRKDNHKGYQVDNCVVCCKLCNRTKSNNFSYDEFKLLGDTIALIRQQRDGVKFEDSPFIHTRHLHTYHPAVPRAEDIDIRDLAHALARLCRFTGHVSSAGIYSVAEHCVRVSQIVAPQFRLWALLHDGSEAYIQDLNHPLKYSSGMAAYRSYEKLAQAAIAQKFELYPATEPPEVKAADTTLLVTEQRDLMWGTSSPGNVQNSRLVGVEPLTSVIVPWSIKKAERKFLERFYQLQALRGAK